MAAHDWRTCTDLEWMIWRMDAGASERKQRLMASAFCRHVGHLMTEERCRRLLAEAERSYVFQGKAPPIAPDFLLSAVDEVEKCADALTGPETLAPVVELADRLSSATTNYYYACYDEGWGPFDHDLIATCEAAGAVYEASRPRVGLAQVAAHAARAVYRAGGGGEQERADPAEGAAQCDLIRDLFRAPRSREMTADPIWLTPAVAALAAQMYESRDFSPMPILVDALQEAGCDNEDILNHCRSGGVHVRGCWVVDLVLGKE
jgi:hypothetical protein